MEVGSELLQYNFKISSKLMKYIVSLLFLLAVVYAQANPCDLTDPKVY